MIIRFYISVKTSISISSGTSKSASDILPSTWMAGGELGTLSDDKGDIRCCGSAGLWPSQAGDWGYKKGDFF